MKLSTAFFLGATALAGVASLSGTANAGVFTAGSIAINASTTTTSAVNGTSVFNFSSAVDLGDSNVATGDFTGLNPTNVWGTTFINTASAASFNFSAGTLGSFAASNIVMIPSAPNFLTFDVFGTYTVGSNFTNAGALITGEEAFALSQVGGPNTSISISGTFFSPEQPIVTPEPETVALFGVGLLGLGLIRRRAKA